MNDDVWKGLLLASALSLLLWLLLGAIVVGLRGYLG